jgi:hypothetical protein
MLKQAQALQCATQQQFKKDIQPVKQNVNFTKTTTECLAELQILYSGLTAIWNVRMAYCA